jgi:hypothetical protein
VRNSYRIFVDFTRKATLSTLRKLAAEYPNVKVDRIGMVVSDNERHMRKLFKQMRNEGFPCNLHVTTYYDDDDARSAEMGRLGLGPASSTQFSATVPSDAFDFSAACPRCGVGAQQVKPSLLATKSIGCRANFYYGHVGTLRPFLRAEIGKEIIKETGQPWCMRHPVTRAGKVVKQWMEPVPCATMPSISRKSKGVFFGKSEMCTDAGEPPEVIDPCSVCGRTALGRNHEFRLQIKYPREVLDWAQRHAVVAMYEPHEGFPTFDPVKRTFKSLYGLPILLFSPAAIRVLIKYCQTEHSRDSAFIEPVYCE